ncbi:uncharacterized protein [Aristolochia californica]|uniref:uncharacterized protein n=1 Tax=Aristolochia californica TaxID=171875 RepID=UPI0035E3541E
MASPTNLSWLFSSCSVFMASLFAASASVQLNDPGIFLFFKVVMEDILQGIAGFWSLDLSKRVVREKTGSGFVVASMFLQLKAFANSNYPRKRRGRRSLDYGMTLLVAVSFGISFVFIFVNGGLNLKGMHENTIDSPLSAA